MENFFSVINVLCGFNLKFEIELLRVLLEIVLLLFSFVYIVFNLFVLIGSLLSVKHIKEKTKNILKWLIFSSVPDFY